MNQSNLLRENWAFVGAFVQAHMLSFNPGRD